jgi:hypothetical protein
MKDSRVYLEFAIISIRKVIITAASILFICFGVHIQAYSCLEDFVDFRTKMGDYFRSVWTVPSNSPEN